MPHDRFYWLAVPPGTGAKDALVIAERKGQTVEILKAENVGKLILRFNDRMMDLDQPVTVRFGGKAVSSGSLPRAMAVILKTLQGCGDPKLVFCAETEVDLGALQLP